GARTRAAARPDCRAAGAGGVLRDEPSIRHRAARARLRRRRRRSPDRRGIAPGHAGDRRRAGTAGHQPLPDDAARAHGRGRLSRAGLWAVAALFLGAFAAHFLLQDRGYVLINFRGYAIEMSVPGLLLVLIAAYAVVRALAAVWNAPRRLGAMLTERRTRKA